MEKIPEEPIYTEDFKKKIYEKIEIMNSKGLSSIEIDNFILSSKVPEEGAIVITTVQNNNNVYYLIAGGF